MNAKYVLPGLVDVMLSLVWMQAHRQSFNAYWWVTTLAAFLISIAWMAADEKAAG